MTKRVLSLCVLLIACGPVTPEDTSGAEDIFTPPPTATERECPITSCRRAEHNTVSPRRSPRLRIADVQGRAHVSSLVGQRVEGVTGVVTLVHAHGFHMQDPAPDGDARTSEGLLVYTGEPPSVVVSDQVAVLGHVEEYRPGCERCTSRSSAHANLSVTQIRAENVAVTARATELPAAIPIGTRGRMPPGAVYARGFAGDVEAAGTELRPDELALDFFESLEGMRVSVSDAVVVGPTRSPAGRKQLTVLPDRGQASELRTARGGLVLREDDANAERLSVTHPPGLRLPNADVGDHLPGELSAVVDYAHGGYRLVADAALPALEPGARAPERARASSSADELSVATWNVHNLDGADSTERFHELAAILVQNLAAPDLILLTEVGDDDGALDDGVVSCSLTLSRLTAAVRRAGGPEYSARSIDPVDGADGGAPGTNIRVVLLARTDRGLKLVDRPGGSALSATAILGTRFAPRLRYSPGLIEPTRAAFQHSRKPLALELEWNGRPLFLVGAHLTSKSGDQPLLGRFQPPRRESEVQRKQQARVVSELAAALLTLAPDAALIVLGDLNDFDYAPTLAPLVEAGLRPLIRTLPVEERYSYVFDGNSQALDHVFVSRALERALTSFQVVHVAAERAFGASDHDPLLARFKLPPPPSASERH